MSYQAMATVKSTEEGLKTYLSGWWETAEKAFGELQGLMHNKMPNGAFQMTLKMKSQI